MGPDTKKLFKTGSILVLQDSVLNSCLARLLLQFFLGKDKTILTDYLKQSSM